MKLSTSLELIATKKKTKIKSALALLIVGFCSGLALLAFYFSSQSSDFQAPEYRVPAKTAINDATNSVTLTWTATGDDRNSGQASAYDIRYSTSSIDISNWNIAKQVANPPTPKPAGQTESLLVTGLQPNQTYYFALKTTDESGNTSGLSNIASKKTAALPACSNKFDQRCLIQ